MRVLYSSSRLLMAAAAALTFLTFFWIFSSSPDQAVPVLNNEHSTPHHNKITEEAPPFGPEPDDAKHQPKPLIATTLRTSISTPMLARPSSSIAQAESAHPSATTPNSKAVHAHTTPAQKKPSWAPSQVQTAFAPFPTGRNATATSTPTPKESTCREMPGASDIMVIVKTSKSSLHAHVPTQLENLLSCVPHHAIFSDHSGFIGNYSVHDCLDEIPAAIKEKHEEFKDYELQKQIKVDSVSKHLDRWTWLPMVYKMYKLQPDLRFYLVIEPDTAISWTNLLQWVARLDSRIPYYAGAPLHLGETKFVQRSSGILLSNTALKKFAKAYDELYESEWQARVAGESLGDVVLATAMADAQVETYGAHPLLQANTPWSVSWDRKYWCVPAVGFHHMGKEQLTQAWNFQKNWTDEMSWKEPYLHRDAYMDFVEPLLVDRKELWDNGAEGTIISQPILDDLTAEEWQEWYEHEEEIREAVQSWESCQKVCERASDCQQWKWSQKDDGECVLGKNIKFGASAPKKEGEEVWISGWYVERVRNTTREWNCEKPSWRFNQ